MRSVPALAPVIAACALVAEPSTADAARDPFTLSHEYQERLTRGAATNRAGTSCRVHFERIEDGRRDRTTLGNVAKRQVRSPADSLAWIRNVLSGLRHRGIEVRFEPADAADAGALAADARLLVAWVSDIRANKSANAAMRIQVRRGTAVALERDYRGVETTMNFASGDRELQKVVDTAFGRMLDHLAPDLLALCHA